MKAPHTIRRIRCAVYTRKSTEEGLEMEFNSLDAQREAGEAYINSQKHEGWMLVSDYYDDGGYSGGNIERPALKRLLQDIRQGKIDVVVVYKVDRLSRSLADFAKMVDLFDQHQVSFVSVTQQFNTTNSMGRLTLNILLSFAQFEREVIGERIRDKLAASKKKGMWMGGTPPMGYSVVERKLIIESEQAKVVKYIFNRFIALGSITMLVKELRQKDIRTKLHTSKTGKIHGGALMHKGFVYNMLNNRIYLGEITHKDKSYPGQHTAIIDKFTWDQAHAIFQKSPRTRANQTRRQTPAILRGILECGGCSSAMTPSHTRKKGKRYCYYVPSAMMKGSCDHCPIGRVSAPVIEEVILGHVRSLLATPQMIIETWRIASKADSSITEEEVRHHILEVDQVWEQLFPAEQERILGLLIEKAIVKKDGIDIELHADGPDRLLQYKTMMR